MKKLLIFFILSFSVVSLADQSTTNSELSKNLDSLSDTNLEGLLDKNLDGEQDVFYEYSDDNTYFELNDSNYDGKVDASCKFDSNDTLVNCKHDQDFNGLLETYIEYNLGMAVREGVDLNNNNLYEIVFHYQSGTLTEGFKYIVEKTGKKMVSKTKFQFGYPVSESLLETTLSEAEFSNLYWNRK